MQESKPFYCNPKHPNFNRRANHHDYTRPAKYLITFLKQPTTPALSEIVGYPPYVSYESAQTILTHVGNLIYTAIIKWLTIYPQIIVPAHAIMPDHVHICVEVTTRLPNGLSRAIGRLKGLISSAYHHSLPDAMRPADMQPLFTKGFNDRIAYDDEQWKNQIHYTRDNPRRYMLKKSIPDYMTRRWIVTMGDEQYMAKGNIFLLKQPHLFPVKFSRRFSDRESVEWMEGCKGMLHNGSIPVSPFIHSKEKELRQYAINEGFAIIRICTNGFAERESASGVEFNLMCEGRLLLIAPLNHKTQKEDLKYEYAQRLNKVAVDILKSFSSSQTGFIRPL
ncbi:MAG: transposase [Muribaculaceae bacterium]|nr:transposase [Muribaculaceae bacterium]